MFLSPEVAYKMADTVVLRTSLMGGLPQWLIGMVSAGAVSAAFFTVAGLLMTGAASISYDIYYRLINPQASEPRRMFIAKGSTLVLSFLVLLAALNPPGLIAEIAAVAFALAGNTIFPAFLLGIWWDRANAPGVIAGMLCGLLITFLPFLAGASLPMITRLLPATSSAFIGAPVVIIVMVCVSLLTAAPSEAIRRFLARDVHDCMEE
jgi:cation/acetate symporter